MTSNGNNRRLAAGQGSPNQAIRPSVLAATLLLVLACLAAGVVFWMKGPSPKAAPEPPPSAQQALQDAAQRPADENVPVLVTNQVPAAAPAGRSPLLTKRPPPSPGSASPAPVVARPEPSPYARQLVNNLVNLEQAGLPKTPEQIAAWKRNLQLLVQQGAVSLPAIQEFLEKNVDFAYGTEGARALGYGSAPAPPCMMLWSRSAERMSRACARHAEQQRRPRRHRAAGPRPGADCPGAISAADPPGIPPGPGNARRRQRRPTDVAPLFDAMAK